LEAEKVMTFEGQRIKHLSHFSSLIIEAEAKIHGKVLRNNHIWASSKWGLVECLQSVPVSLLQ
jgi:hypothetical protein